MEFDLSWVLLGFPFVFALGWWASRIDWRQWRLENSQAPRAYFKGLNFLLNEQQDQAIDAFIEAVQKDPETSDLHFALGSLFRRRGEFDRAIRVHEHLLSRADLPRDDRERARHELALDFMKAGLYDRAEAAWAELERTAYAQEAALGQLVICERWHDWPRAAALAQKLLAGQGQMPLTHDLARNLAHNLAHYLCEQAAAAQEPGEKLALLEQKHRFWRVLHVLGEFFPAWATPTPNRDGGVWVFRTVCFERVVLSSPGCGAHGQRRGQTPRKVARNSIT